MKEIVFIFPNQLFKDNPLLSKNREISIIEHPRYFTDFIFHKQKLVLHRASMKEYFDLLKRKKYSVDYIEFINAQKYIKTIEKKSTVHCIDPIDHDFKKELVNIFKQKKIKVIWYESPLFLTTSKWIEKNFSNKKRFLMNSFYIQQRKRLKILVKNDKPIGGKWSFDPENREKLPNTVKIPSVPKLRTNKFIKEAQKYIAKNFDQNPGNIDQFLYPTNSRSAKKWFENFLKKRFKNFGTYQDAMKKGEPFLFHSVLSPLLNIGLLTPQYVIEKALKFAKKNKIPLNSLEGFIRQIIGWREFVRAVYQVIGPKQKKANFFKNKLKLPKAFYNSTTNIDPVDDIIKKLHNNAYSHHIERLMVLGNIMLLLQIKPDEVYKWFMEMYIDSYDWVMVPNVYGMSQYADSRITTKPYISSSNYILKMSNYKKNDWSKIWDSLFWSFIKKHEKKLIKIPRMRFIMSILKKKTSNELREYKKIAKEYTDSLGLQKKLNQINKR